MLASITRTVVVMAIVAGCSAPEKPRAWKPRKDAIVPSADREHPTPLGELAADAAVPLIRRAHLLADVPGPGTWWIAVDVLAVPERVADLTVYALVPRDIAPSAIALVDASTGEATPGTLEHLIWTATADKQSADRHWLLRVTTPHAMHFKLDVEQRIAPIPDPVDPPVVERPRCDANTPDFTNPRCCTMSDCSMGRFACMAKIIEIYPDRSGFQIDVGADRELMARARVFVRVAGKAIAHGVVGSVAGKQASVRITDGAANLEVGRGDVIIERPEECTQRR